MKNSSYIECDTEQLVTSADKILLLVCEYEKYINSFFSSINFNEYNPAWTGNNAKLYGTIAMQDKMEYIEFGNEIKNIAKEMKEFANELDGKINECEEICENAQDSYSSFFY